MSIVIKTKKIGIPVTIGELEFVVDTSDEGIESLAERHEEVLGLVNTVEEGDNVSKAKSVLEQGFDLFLGDGAFEQIYEQTPSTVLCAEYLAALLEGVAEEMQKQQTQVNKSLQKKYLKKK